MRYRIVASHIILRSYPHLCRIGYIINERDEKMKKTYSLLKNSIITFVILLLCFAICMGTVNNKMNTIHYISAELVEATVFSFENDESFKLLELDDRKIQKSN